jgi:hypothetical protein
MSCDLLPTERPGPHHQGDVLEILADGWDMMIAHPDCTRLTNAGVRWLYVDGKKENGVDEEQWAKMVEGAYFYLRLRNANIPLKAIENPIMHGHAMRIIQPGHRQFVQPWWFGEKAFKATGLELVGLPDLVPTNKLTPPKPGTEEHKAWSKCHREPPGQDRWKNRSRTYQGIAEAMATQWTIDP